MPRTWQMVAALRYSGSCQKCDERLSAGQRAFWNHETRELRCTGCHSNGGSLHAQRPLPLKPKDVKELEDGRMQRDQRNDARIEAREQLDQDAADKTPPRPETAKDRERQHRFIVESNHRAQKKLERDADRILRQAAAREARKRRIAKAKATHRRRRAA